MNGQGVQHNFSRDAVINSINPELISMQMQALRESLRRLEECGVDVQLDMNEHIAIEVDNRRKVF